MLGVDPATRDARRHRALRGVIGAVGRTLIALGVLILLFVAYQLWGTNLAESRSQDDLRRSFEAALGPGAAAPPSPTPSTTTTAPLAPPTEGDAVARIVIPKIDVDKVVVEGVGVPDLKKGPGHYPGSPLPGQPGNAAIAGHRTTYGAPFSRLDELLPGDVIDVATRQGRFRYRVHETKVVKPSQTEVLDPTTDARLTLTTCHPRFSAAERMIVVALLEGETAPAPPPSPVTRPRPTSLDGEAGLSGDPAARGPAVLWGFGAALVALAFWVLGQFWRRWPAYLIGTPVFLAVLFVFFENFSRLLPANI